MPIPMSMPTVSVYWNRRIGQFLIQKHAPILTGPFAGATEEIGRPITVDSEDVNLQVVSLVLQALQAFQVSQSDVEQPLRRRDEEQLEFAKQHLLVSVTSIPSGKIRVSACERRGGSYLGISNGEATVDPNSAIQQLPHVLREAFRKAR